MLYRVFDNQEEVAKANGRWLVARNNSPEYDRKLSTQEIVDPQITSAWDYGKEMLNGKIACQVPIKWKDDFGGTELELTDKDFPIIEEMEV